MSYTAKDIQELFLNASPEECKAFLLNCPDTNRKSIALDLAGRDGQVACVQALQILADDMVLQAHLPLGTEMAKAAVKASRVLHLQPEQPKELVRSIANNSALSWADGLLKEGRWDECIKTIEENLDWLNAIPTLTDQDKQDREALHIKWAGVCLDQGDIDCAKTLIDKKIDVSALSDIQRVTFDTLELRLRRLAQGPDAPPDEIQRKDIETAIAQLRQLVPLLGSFQAMGWIKDDVVDRVHQLIKKLDVAETYDVEFAAEVMSILSELRELTSKDPSMR